LALLAPPTALAQGLSGSSTTPVPYGMLPGGTAAPLPGQPIITNPTALQPNVPAQIPCPAPLAPTQVVEGAVPALNEFWPTETGTLLPSSVEQRMRLEREAREEQTDKELHEKEKRERERGIKEQLELQKAGLSATPGGAAGAQMAPSPVSPAAKPQPLEQTKTKDFTIEEAFAQFSVLQGVKARLKQFGYDFFDVQATSFAPVLDVPVGPVYVVGEVVRPGAYELSALASVSNAIYAACGPAKSGSLRQVRVMREGKPLADLDFYDFLLRGDRSQDRRLQAGDVVVVPPLGMVTAISGSVKRSAIYEVKPGARLSDLLSLAGGLTPLADQRRCHLFRLDPGRGRYLMDVDLTATVLTRVTNKDGPPSTDVDPLLQDGDYVQIASLPTQVANVVSLVGAVKSPGPYEYRSGMRLKDLLMADQLTVDAYVDRAEIIRTDL